MPYREPDKPPIRNPMLYPLELRAHRTRSDGIRSRARLSSACCRWGGVRAWVDSSRLRWCARRSWWFPSRLRFRPLVESRSCVTHLLFLGQNAPRFPRYRGKAAAFFLDERGNNFFIFSRNPHPPGWRIRRFLLCLGHVRQNKTAAKSVSSAKSQGPILARSRDPDLFNCALWKAAVLWKTSGKPTDF